MEPTVHKLIHTFGALADLGQEVANTGDFGAMVQTSLHLLLGTLAIRRGAVIENKGQPEMASVASWGLPNEFAEGLSVGDEERASFLRSLTAIIHLAQETTDLFLGQDRELLIKEGIELAFPMVIRGEL